MNCKSLMYRRKCVDDTLLLSRLKDHMENIRNDLNPIAKLSGLHSKLKLETLYHYLISE